MEKRKKDNQDWLRSEGDVSISSQRQAWIDANIDEIPHCMGNIITLTPALTITKDQMDKALGIIDRCLGEVERT